MSLFRRPRLGLSVAVVVAAIAAVVGALAPPAQAFQIQNHERVTRDALTPVGVDPAAMGQILVGPPPGAGAVGSDAFFADAFRHIDNANTPVDICALTQQAWNFFTPLILSGAQPAGPGGTDLVDGPARPRRLRRPGTCPAGLLLPLQLGRRQHRHRPTGPHATPADAHLRPGHPAPGTAHRILRRQRQPRRPAGRLPTRGPAAGFAECHSTLNKDDWSTPRGIILVPGTNPPINNYDLAGQLATKATTDLYWQVRNLIVADAGECAADNLFQADRRQSCW